MNPRPREAEVDESARCGARRVELILQQLQAMPTLSAVAVKLLDLTAAEDSQAKDVVALIAMDPALASKVLRLCRCSALGRGKDVHTVERAVMLLGFEAVRGAVLSVQVFELLEGLTSAGGEVRRGRAVFDRQMFWQHSIAVGVASEMIVRGARLKEIRPTEAFLAGLLHDLGQLALHVVLPATFDQVCELAESHALSLDAACRRAMGMDTHTAGKRLAESWQLPPALADVLWLSGQPYASLPDLPHRKLIGLVTLADTLARRMHIAPTGHAPSRDDLSKLCDEMGIPSARVVEMIPQLHEEVALRAEALGLKVEHSSELLLRSISRANEVLGRINGALEARTAMAAGQARILKAVARFHEGLVPGMSVAGVLGRVVVSTLDLLGDGTCSVLYRAGRNEAWQLLAYARDGRLARSRAMGGAADLRALDDLAGGKWSALAGSLVPQLAANLKEIGHGAGARLTALGCGGGVNVVLVHDREMATTANERRHLEAALCTWGASISAAAEHETARTLSEQLAEANRELSDTQDQLARSRTLASLGEIAAGAAHEMNNPLTVISGRAQILAARLEDDPLRPMAEQIAVESTRLSELITALRTFAEPACPSRRSVDLKHLLRSVVEEVRPRTPADVRVDVHVPADLPQAWVDPDLIARAVLELLVNALEARPARRIELRVQTDASNDRLTVQVVDDGPGLNEHALAHAFDPFFSGKPAGRQPGLGLAHARRAIEAHGGQITLRNAPGGGALATIWLGDWIRREVETRREVA